MDRQKFIENIRTSGIVGAGGAGFPTYVKANSKFFRSVHPVRDFRKAPVKKLIKKLGLTDYDKPAPLVDFDYEVKKVKILLSQHIGAVCKPTVKVGDYVKKGQIIGKVEESELGAFVHSSIDGKITKLNEKYLEIEKC